MPIRIGRWQAELHQRAIYITREPNPNCPDCSGERRAWWVDSPYDEPCHCLDQLRTWRLPLWRRRPYPVEEPF
ncbi:hypothetical protein [Streptomyces sp. NEAU-174]|uniref:hypothetical protein n=1 Tax=Streptomyces sp. NEAU-174 TaxID=3458254 RepID=UPI00404445AB